MYFLLDESEDIYEDLLLILLSTLGRNKKVGTFYLSLMNAG